MDITHRYTALGGKFVMHETTIADKLKNIKAFIFDWDGVFNDGSKTVSASSSFSEVDSMGTNLLRYSSYLLNAKVPITAIISGEKNETAFYFAKRECFHYSFFKTAVNKVDAMKFICRENNIEPAQVAYFFDDVLDLGIAELCGLRILVNQKANPLFSDFCVRNQMVDYVSANTGGQHAIREVTELLIALNGNYDKVLHSRKDASKEYNEYLSERKKIHTAFYTFTEGSLQPAEI